MLSIFYNKCADGETVQQTCEFLQTSLQCAFILAVATAPTNAVDTAADAAQKGTLSRGHQVTVADDGHREVQEGIIAGGSAQR